MHGYCVVPIPCSRDMPLRDDIIRGARAGAILLALLLLAFAAYRVMREPAAVVEAPAAPAAPEKHIPPPPAVVESGGRKSVPPPPPVSGVKRSGQRAPAQNLAIRSEAAPDSVVVKEEKAATGISEPVAAVEEERQNNLTKTALTTETEPDPASDASDSGLPSSQSRGRRMLKAVGRFLHIGPKKDLPQQAIRPGN